MATRIASLKNKLTKALGPSLGILACAYFAYHTVHGDRGITSMMVLQDKVAEAQILADELHERRDDWETPGRAAELAGPGPRHARGTRPHHAERRVRAGLRDSSEQAGGPEQWACYPKTLRPPYYAAVVSPVGSDIDPKRPAGHGRADFPWRRGSTAFWGWKQGAWTMAAGRRSVTGKTPAAIQGWKARVLTQLIQELNLKHRRLEDACAIEVTRVVKRLFGGKTPLAVTVKGSANDGSEDITPKEGCVMNAVAPTAVEAATDAAVVS